MRKPPSILTPRIIADLRAGEECADPYHPGLRVRRTNAARGFFYRYRAPDDALRETKLGKFGPMTFSMLTGCRAGEVVAARWRDIDLQRAVWTIRETKNGEPHDVMFPRQVIDLLTARRTLDEVLVFPSPKDGHHVG